MPRSLIEKAKEVSEKHIKPFAEKIADDDCFPWEIWKELGKSGILGLGVPAEFSGAGAGAREISESLHELVFTGGNIGICLSALIHNMVAGFVISEHGTVEQKQKLLPLMANGQVTCAFAVSEPGRGGHPKFIQTKAERTDPDSYSISGEKTYLTNGPVSDYFVVIAVTDENEGRKKFSAFLADSSKSGIEKSPQMKISFFRPSPHGGIILNGYMASMEDIIGVPGRAYDDIVLPFRDIENSLMAGPVSGALRRITTEAVKMAASKSGLSKDALSLLGRMGAVSDLARDMALKMAEAVDSDAPKNSQRKYFFQFREICQVFNTLIPSWEGIMASESINIENYGLFNIMKNDLVKSSGLGEYILKVNLAKAGEGMIRSCINNGSI